MSSLSMIKVVVKIKKSKVPEKKKESKDDVNKLSIKDAKISSNDNFSYDI